MPTTAESGERPSLSTILEGKKAIGGKKTYTWSLASGELPEGLILESSSGKITGIPMASGSFDLTFRATDALGGTVTEFTRQGLSALADRGSRVLSNARLNSSQA